MDAQQAKLVKAAADREVGLLRHLALCRELQEALGRTPEGEGRRKLQRALARAELLSMHFADAFCDAFDEEIGPRLGLAATDPAKPR